MKSTVVQVCNSHHKSKIEMQEQLLCRWKRGGYAIDGETDEHGKNWRAWREQEIKQATTAKTTPNKRYNELNRVREHTLRCTCKSLKFVYFLVAMPQERAMAKFCVFWRASKANLSYFFRT